MLNKFEKISKDSFLNAYKKSSSKREIAKLLNLVINGTTMKYINKMLIELDLKIPIKVHKKKYERIDIKCPVCKKIFTTQLNHPKSKKTCSYSCSNTYFRTGKKNGSYIQGQASYRIKAFSNKKHCCEICNYSKIPEILEVHHKDRNRNNNNISNLVLLCPNCHNEEHYSSKDGKWSKKIN